jgi:hypothetical protein
VKNRLPEVIQWFEQHRFIGSDDWQAMSAYSLAAWRVHAQFHVSVRSQLWREQ